MTVSGVIFDTSYDMSCCLANTVCANSSQRAQTYLKPKCYPLDRNAVVNVFIDNNNIVVSCKEDVMLRASTVQIMNICHMTNFIILMPPPRSGAGDINFMHILILKSL